MSPLYSYRCECGEEIERLRKFRSRKRRPTCTECGEKMEWLFPIPHVLPDGVYSHCPNIGREEDFARKVDKIAINKERKKDGKAPGFER